MTESSVPETVINVLPEGDQDQVIPEIRPCRPFNVSSIMAEEWGSRLRASSAASSAAYLNSITSNNNNNINSFNNYTDTMTSNRSRHLSFTRLTYNLSAFNREFDKIPKEKANSFLRIVDPRPIVAPANSKNSLSPATPEAPSASSDGNENDDQFRDEEMAQSGAGSPSPAPGKQHVRQPWKKCFQEKFCCSQQQLLRIITSLLPILKWSSEYSVRDSLIPDLIAGLTIIVFHVPQSMGYSLIAHVSPVYGLYTAFFPALIYSLMGTSKHCAIGMFAVISLMTGTLILEAKEELRKTLIMAATPAASSVLTDSTTVTPDLLSLSSSGDVVNEMDDDSINIRIAVAVSFLIGFYQLVFGIMQMGFISVYLSEQLVSGFTTAASLYVFTSQLPFLFGVHLPHRSGPLSLVYAYIDLCSHLSEANLLTIGISVTCCIILLIFKIYVNHKIKDRLGIDIPFPIELILVIIGTTASYFMQLETRDIKIVGKIPTGLPAPLLPDWDLMLMLAKKSIPLAIVAYTLTISVGKIFATRHNYELDPNQELIALGSLNIISCFFSCLPSAASLSRSAVQESAGGRTQLVSIINSIGILFVLYFAGSLLEKLPICILACIISVALKSLFMQIIDFIRYWHVSKLDASIWLITFVAVVLLDVDLGLYVGLGYSLLTLIYKSQRPKTYLLGSVGASDVYVPERKYASAARIPGILIYQFCGPLHFANTEFFQKDLIAKTGVAVPVIRKEQDRVKQIQHQRREMLQNGNARRETRRTRESGGRASQLGNEEANSHHKVNLIVSPNSGKEDLPFESLPLKHRKQEMNAKQMKDAEIWGNRLAKGNNDDDGSDYDEDDRLETADLIRTKTGDPIPSHIIIDCSMFSYIDIAGVSQLKSTVQDYESIGIKMFLAGVATHVDNMLELDGFYRAVPSHHVYITIHDAVHHALQDHIGDCLQQQEQQQQLRDGQRETASSPDGNNVTSNYSTTSDVSQDDENQQQHVTVSTAFRPVTVADHLSHYRDRLLLNNKNMSSSGSSLPVGTQYAKRRSIVGFFEDPLSQDEGEGAGGGEKRQPRQQKITPPDAITSGHSSDTTKAVARTEISGISGHSSEKL